MDSRRNNFVGVSLLKPEYYPQLSPFICSVSSGLEFDTSSAFSRFQSWGSEKSSSFEHDRFFESIRRGFGRWSGAIKSLKNNPISIPSVADQPRKDHSGPMKTKIFDPQDQFFQTWNKIVVLSCVVSVALDPLFFYTPVLKVNEEKKCLDCSSDTTLAIIASVLRSVTDAFYAIHIYFQFRTGIIARSSRDLVFESEELIDDPMLIAKRYLSRYFIIDILAILPCPQVVVFVISPSLKNAVPMVMLKFVIFSQYVPRLLRIYPLYVQVVRSSGRMTKTIWGGAAYNFFLYMLASHVVGAFWYFFGINRQDACWQKMCRKINGCRDKDFYCGNKLDQAVYVGLLSQACRIVGPDEAKNSTDYFDYGIFTTVLKSGVVESTDFLVKCSYCFWWGFRNLSSIGQNLETSTYFWEIVFVVFIAISGLVLFLVLIGNVQIYLQSTTTRRVQEMMVRKIDTEQWMSRCKLPKNLRQRVKRYEQCKWLQIRTEEEENFLCNLPKDIRRDVKRYRCLDHLMKVPMFEKMDQQLWDPLVDRLKPVLYPQDSYIVREGDPVDEMLFIMQGNLAAFTTNGGTFFETADLKAGDFCGEELLTWALYPQFSTKFPISTRTVEAKTEVQAFALMAEDLKTVASQFWELHYKELQHTFKFYSQQWRTWAACFIQSAWRCYSKKKHERALCDAESRLQFALANEDETLESFGATMQRLKGTNNTTVLQLPPPKLVEPNFNVKGDNIPQEPPTAVVTEIRAALAEHRVGMFNLVNMEIRATLAEHRVGMVNLVRTEIRSALAEHRGIC